MATADGANHESEAVVEFLRIWESDIPARRAEGWRFVAGWFCSMGRRWAWCEREVRTDG